MKKILQPELKSENEEKSIEWESKENAKEEVLRNEKERRKEKEKKKKKLTD